MRLLFLCSQTNDSKLYGFLPVAAKIFRRRSEGAAEGGCGGNSVAPERWSPAACSVRSRSQQKSFLCFSFARAGFFLLKGKENFFAGWRALVSGGGANQLLFRSKKVRAKCKISPPSPAIAGFGGRSPPEERDGGLRSPKRPSADKVRQLKNFPTSQASKLWQKLPKHSELILKI